VRFFQDSQIDQAMERKPKQSRSIASTARMLDAAEALFANGGADAVTVDAIVRQAKTSVGAFYARFADRAGLLAAMHQRFIERMAVEAQTAVSKAFRQADLARAVAAFVKHALPAARKHRESILFFVVTSATESPLRKQGLAANPGFAAAFAAAVMPFRGEIAHSHPEDAIDVAFRILFAVFLQRALFTPGEATGKPINDASLAKEIAHCLVAYLTTPFERS